MTIQISERWSAEMVAKAIQILPRLGELLDPDHPDYDPTYWEIVGRIVERQGFSQEQKNAWEIIWLVRECDYRVLDQDCGCEGNARCLLKKGRDGIVNMNNCRACILSPAWP